MDSSTSTSNESPDQHSHADGVRSGVRVVIVHGGGPASEVLSERHADWTLLTLTKSLLDDLDSLVPDVVVIDRSASVDLVRVCRDIRSRSTARVIALGNTPGDDDLAAIEVLRAGADDYLSRTTRLDALVARINATAIVGADAVPGRGHCVGDVEIDDAWRVVRVAGVVVPCSRLRLALLTELARTPNAIVSTHSLLEALWGPTRRELTSDGSVSS